MTGFLGEMTWTSRGGSWGPLVTRKIIAISKQKKKTLQCSICHTVVTLTEESELNVDTKVTPKIFII